MTNATANGKKRKQQQPPERMPATALMDRQLPCDLQAEIGLIGSAFLMPEVLDSAVLIIKPEDFYDDANALIFKHMTEAHGAGKKIDDVLFVDRLKKSGDLEAVGGARYLAEVVNAVPNAAHALYYAEIIREKSTFRRIIYKSTELLRDAYDEIHEANHLVSLGESGFSKIAEEAMGTAEIKQLNAATLDAMGEIQKRINGESIGRKTGIAGFDDARGLIDGELTIIAGRPAMGKSALAVNIAVHAAKHSHDAVLVVSLEMNWLELSCRMLSSEGRVSLKRLNDGSVDQMDRARLLTATESLGLLPLFIDDRPGRTISQIAAQARRIKRKSGLSLIVIDYLQLIEPDDPKVPRQEQVAKISRRLKLMARELNVPVICLAQLNRQTESSKDNIPKLSHLRESGAIEQDADNVLFVHRPKYYEHLVPSDGSAEEAKIILAKARAAESREIDMYWFGRYQRWDNPATQQQHTSKPYTDGGD